MLRVGEKRLDLMLARNRVRAINVIDIWNNHVPQMTLLINFNDATSPTESTVSLAKGWTVFV